MGVKMCANSFFFPLVHLHYAQSRIQKATSSRSLKWLTAEQQWRRRSSECGETVRPETTLNPLVVLRNLPELWQRHQEIMQDNAGEAPSIRRACRMSLISTQEQGYDEQFLHASNLSRLHLWANLQE